MCVKQTIILRIHLISSSYKAELNFCREAIFVNNYII